MKLKVSELHTKHTDGIKEIIHPAATMQGLMDYLQTAFPAYHNEIFSEGKIPRFLLCFRNEDDIRYLDGMETTLSDNDTVTIMNAFAGG
jgi:molybdopterin converting factor small subunit